MTSDQSPDLPANPTGRGPIHAEGDASAADPPRPSGQLTERLALALLAIVVVLAVAAILTAVHGTSAGLDPGAADREFVRRTLSTAARLSVVVLVFFVGALVSLARAKRASSTRASPRGR